MINVLLVDDHGLVRMGVKRLLENTPDINQIYEAENVISALDVVEHNALDLVILDLMLPDISGIEAIIRLRKKFPYLKLIALTAHAEAPLPGQFIAAGGNGYVLKSNGADELIKAIKTVMKQDTYITPSVARDMALSNLAIESATPLSQLSQRELEIALHIVNGDPLQDIALNLELSQKTISTYRGRIFKKLGIENDVQLARLAAKEGLAES